jgi:hypothetical protein
MSSHESFWVATAAAAPVIALTAIVALPDTSVVVERVSRYRQENKNPSIPARDRNRQPLIVDYLWSRKMAYAWSQLVWMMSVVNLLLQATLLAMSLWALAYDQEVIPPWAAIVFSAGGLLLLTWSSTSAAAFRRFLENNPDSVSSSGNEKSPP